MSQKSTPARWIDAARAAAAPSDGSLGALQALRAVAALSVVIYHMPHHAVGLTAAAGDKLNIFAVGVDIFFVLSGFVIAYSVARRPRGPVSFLRDRVARVAPLYWVALLCVLALYWLGMRPLGIQSIAVDDVLSSFFFIIDRRADGQAYPILPVGWTLNYEMLFYGAFALGLLARSPRSAALIAASAVLGLVLLGQIYEPTGFVAASYTSSIMLEFAAGVALARLYVARLAEPADGSVGVLGLLLALAGVAALVAVQASGAVESVEPVKDPRRLALYGGPAFAIVAGVLLMERAGWTVRSPLWLFLGTSSYALYLFHHFLVQAVAKLFDAAPAFPLKSAALAAAILVGSVVLGGLAHLAIERPLARWLTVRQAGARGAKEKVAPSADRPPGSDAAIG